MTSNGLMAKDIEIMLGDQNLLKASIFSASEFSARKTNLTKAAGIEMKKRGVSRIWTDQNGHYYLELYNKVAVQFQTLNDLEKIKKVDFVRLAYSSKENEISFLSNIDKADFLQLKQKATVPVAIKQLSFFGEFYHIENSSKVLVAWSQHFKKGEYAILHDIRTMIGIDWELNYFIEYDEDQLKGAENRHRKGNSAEIPFEIENGTHTNSTIFRQYLAGVLNMDIQKLDYSAKSLNDIEESLLWNADYLDAQALVLPLTSYIGEILVQEKSLQWDKPSHLTYGILLLKKNQSLDLAARLQEGLVGTDYGLPEVKWVFETIMGELD